MRERTRNPFTRSASGGRILSAAQLPFFALRPPRDYGVLATRGRKTGKRRRRCVRAVRSGDDVYIVAIKGSRTGWLQNIRVDPNVALRLRSGRFTGKAREASGDLERSNARDSYCNTKPGFFERAEYRMWRKGRPTPEGIRDLHRTWFETGTPLIVKLDRRKR